MECVVLADGDGDFGEIGYGSGFTLGDSTGVGGIVFGVGGNACGGFCMIGCVGRIDLVMVR